MTQHDCRTPHTTIARPSRRRRTARDARVRRSFDGVVASYLRDLSLTDRERPSTHTPAPLT
jgi:hypothetical protein